MQSIALSRCITDAAPKLEYKMRGKYLARNAGNVLIIFSAIAHARYTFFELSNDPLTHGSRSSERE